MSAAPHVSVESMFDISVVSQLEMMSGPSWMPESYTCLFDLLGKLSKSDGFAKQWNEIESSVKKHLDAWKKCRTLPNKDESARCFKFEEDVVTLIHYKYLALVEKLPNGTEFVRKYITMAQKCGISYLIDDQGEDF